MIHACEREKGLRALEHVRGAVSRSPSGRHKTRRVVFLLAGVALLAATGLAQAASAQTVSETERLARELLGVPDNQLDIGNAALRLSALVYPDVDLARGLRTLDSIAERARIVAGNRTDPELRIRALNTVLYKELRIHYDFDDMMGEQAGTHTLWRLLLTRRGNCVSLPVLWFAIAERLGYPVYAVSAPQHTFLRYDDGQFRSNIEATSGGGDHADAVIIEDLGIPDEAVRSGAELRSLTKREYLASLIAETAAVLSHHGEFDRSTPMLEASARALPVSIGAHWNLAVGYRRQYRLTGSKSALVSALKHAKLAVRLGASAPLQEDYWRKVSSLGANEGHSVKVKPAPFDVVRYLGLDKPDLILAQQTEHLRDRALAAQLEAEDLALLAPSPAYRTRRIELPDPAYFPGEHPSPEPMLGTPGLHADGALGQSTQGAGFTGNSIPRLPPMGAVNQATPPSADPRPLPRQRPTVMQSVENRSGTGTMLIPADDGRASVEAPGYP